MYFVKEDSSSEAGPTRVKGCQEGEAAPTHFGQRASAAITSPRNWCLKHNHNNHKEKRAERRLSWDCMYVSFVLSTMAQAREPGGHGAAECSFRKQTLPIQPGCLSSRIMHQPILRVSRSPGESWVRHGDRRLKAKGSLLVTSCVQSQHSGQEPGWSPACMGLQF